MKKEGEKAERKEGAERRREGGRMGRVGEDNISKLHTSRKCEMQNTN